MMQSKRPNYDDLAAIKSPKEARREIENMDALSREETDEIKKRIDELEELQKSGLSKKDRWANVSASNLVSYR